MGTLFGASGEPLWLMIAFGIINAIGASGILVWIYNRSFAYLHESTLKKSIALLSLPISCIGGMLLSTSSAAIRIPLAVAAVATIAATIYQARRTAADNARCKRRRVPLRKGADIAWKNLTAIERVVMRAVSPINHPTALVAKEYALRIPELPAEFENCRVVYMSDFHIHRTLSDEYYLSAIDAANALRPDVILLGGDYVTREAHVPRVGSILSGLRAPEGIFAIRGNHDYWTRPDAIAAELESVGACVLRNEFATIKRGDAELRILGLETPWLPLGKAAHARIRGEGRPHLAIVHTPDCFPLARDFGAPIAIAGHTHGGQVRLPFFGTTISASRMGPGFGLGSRMLGPLLAITSSGVGSFVPLRVRCAPEVLLLLLTRG